MTHTNQDRHRADRKEREVTDNKRAADDAEREKFNAWFKSERTRMAVSPSFACKAWARAAWQAALSSRADGGKGEAVYQVRPQGQLKWQDVEAISLSMYSDAEKYATRVLYTAPQAECAPREAVFPERDESKPAEQQGIFRKFEVRRVDGSDQPGGKHHGCRYFVLDMDHDAHAPAALRAYADSCANSHPQLAADLRTEFGKGEGVAARKLDAARGWIEDREHGDNCFVSNQYVGDQGSRCNCGKDAILGYLESDTAPQVECAPHTYDPATQWGDPNFDGAEAYQAHLNAECAPREAQPVPWTYDQVVMLCETDGVPLPVEFIEWVAEKMTRAANDALAAPTPERAQPVGPRTTLNYDGTFDTTCAHCGGNGCFACLKSAAPTPERADADTATCPNCKGTGSHGGRFHTDGKGSSEYEPYKCDVCNGFGRVSADADKRELSWQEGYKTGYDDAETVAKHAAGASERADADTVGASDERIEELIEQSGGFWVDDEFRINCRDLTQLIRDASQERADAGKDAALLEALRKIAAIENKMYGGDWDEIEEARSIASIAILAANKETPERAAPRALTDESLSALFKVLMRRNIECGIEAYLTLRCVGVPPSEKDFLSAIEQAVKEPK